MKKIIPFIFAILLAGYGCTSNNGSKEHSPAKNENSASTPDHYEEAADATPPLTGTMIPDVEVRNIEGEKVKLMNLVGEKPTVLIFYRGGWCPYCSRHMAELQRVEQKMVDMGYQILAISPDKPEKLKASVHEHDLEYTLLSDSPMQATSKFGLAYQVDKETVERYKKHDIDLEESSGYAHHLLPVPAVFLVDTGGQIKFQYVNPDYKTRIKSDVLLAAAEAYYPENENES